MVSIIIIKENNNLKEFRKEGKRNSRNDIYDRFSLGKFSFIYINLCFDIVIYVFFIYNFIVF